jgi:formylglycine-generating enzyme required for sulfatase activity
MEDILARLGYTLEKKLNVSEDLNVWDKVISYLSDIIGLRKHVNPSNLNQRYSDHEELYLVNDDFFNTLLKKEFNRIPWKYKNERTQRPELSAKLSLLANIIETMYYYQSHQLTVKNSKTITASDIAMYSFCPASYSIHKSYEIKATPLTENGKKLHEENRLINKIKTGKINEEYYTENEYKHFLNDINNSKLIFSGHSEKDKNKFFREKDFVCQPDYIFQNRDGKYFVVEEKFRFVQKKRVEKTDSRYDETYYTYDDDFNDVFYNNHQLQLASYIYGISEMKIDYGYLIYWQMKNSEMVKCIVKKVDRNHTLLRDLRTIYSRVALFNADKVVAFDKSALNINKCTNCSVAGICGHKHHVFSELKLPYFEGNYISPRKCVLPIELSEYANEFKKFLSPNYQCQICHNWCNGSDISNGIVAPIDYKNGYYFKIVDPPHNSPKIIELNELNPFSLTITEKYNYFSRADYIMKNIFRIDKMCVNCKKQTNIPLTFKFLDDKSETFEKFNLTPFNKSEMAKNGISYKRDKIRKNITLHCKHCNTYWEPTAYFSNQIHLCKICDINPLLIPTENIDPEIKNEIECEMIFIEGGTFKMGNNERQWSTNSGYLPMSDSPIHTVTLTSFYISKYPITHDQWYSVMGFNLSNDIDSGNCPVKNVSWNDAQLFIKRLNETTHEKYRLPTEAEWEYAARGGKDSSDDGRYTHSFKIPEVKIKPVGKGDCNLLGIFDMSGNVQEWCEDWLENWSWDIKKNEPLIDPKGPDTGSNRVLRGGWCGGRTYYRSTYRTGSSPSERSMGIGFRIAKSI